jgi:Holliday junction resolvasome RuvABC endonuclease subunit
MKDNCLLCLDCATQIFGWAIIRKSDYSLIDFGQIECDNKDTIFRINYMVDEVEKIVDKYVDYIDEAVVEDVPPSIQNALTVLQLGRINGAILYLLHKNNIEAHLLPVSTWHSKLGFKGKKPQLKEQSIKWANEKYGLNLKFVSPNSKFNEDNKSDPICFGCVWLGNYGETRGFNKGVR